MEKHKESVVRCKPASLIAKVSYHPLMGSRCLDTVPESGGAAAAVPAVEAAAAAVDVAIAVTAAVYGETPLQSCIRSLIFDHKRSRSFH